MILPHAPKAVIFDLDGLLIDSEKPIFEAMRATAPGFGREMTPEIFRNLVGLPRAANDAELLKHYGADFPVNEFTAAVSAHVNAEKDMVAALKTGVAEILDALDGSHLPRALCTSSSRAWVDRHFAAYDLAPRFDAIIARGDYVNGKPSPEPFLKVAAALGADPLACLALEDSHNGVRAAHGAGMMVIMIPDMLEANEEMRAKTIHIAHSLHEVAALFAR